MPTAAELNQPLLGKPSPPETRVRPKKNIWKTIGCFVIFVAVRSFHPIVIDHSKTDGKLPYGKATPCVINQLVGVIAGNAIALMHQGMPGLKACWNPDSLKIFSAIAIAYAFVDFLEMQSMSVMGGAVYQILLQSKLVITALIVWVLRGQRQTSLQWNILLTTMIAMSAICVVQEESSSAGGSFPLIGIFFVVLKVVFSCACAVLAEKYLKAFGSMPIYMQVAQLKFMWLWASLALTWTFDSNVREFGFFDGWDGRTVLVAMSWVCKDWTTFLVLKNLDSVLKNIGEAAAVLVIYLFEVMTTALSESIPEGANEFKLSTFLMVLVVCLTVVSYILPPAQRK